MWTVCVDCKKIHQLVLVEPQQKATSCCGMQLSLGKSYITCSYLVATDLSTPLYVTACDAGLTVVMCVFPSVLSLFEHICDQLTIVILSHLMCTAHCAFGQCGFRMAAPNMDWMSETRSLVKRLGYVLRRGSLSMPTCRKCLWDLF